MKSQLKPQPSTKTFRAYLHDTLRLHYIFIARDGETWYVKTHHTKQELFGDEINVPLSPAGTPDFLALRFRRQTKCPAARPEMIKAVWQRNDPEAGRGKKLLAELKESYDALMSRFDSRTAA